MKHRLPASLPLLCLALSLAGAGCGSRNHVEAKPAVAVARLAPSSGSNVSGTVTFTQQGNGVRVVAHLTGLSEGTHGFHIHEKGDCSAPDASSAGGHFNPFGHDHGAPAAATDKRHAGDLGNIEAKASGKADYERTDTVLSFTGEASILGRSVIVHEKADDLTTQPTGNAGGRVACGVIEKAP